jgi:phosphomevalonate kinase
VSLGPFLAAARDVIAEELGADSPAAEAAARVVVDTGALTAADGTKLGLGSSAAATVAGIACALTAGGVEATPACLHRLAHRAHGNAQALRGARGSGADVAASVHGGVAAVLRKTDPAAPMSTSPLAWPPVLRMVAVWTGQAASTPDLIARVTAAREERPAAYRRALAQIAAASTTLARALGTGDAAGAVAAVAAGHRAARSLGKTVGVPLVSPLHQRLEELARASGGAAKPTGAGAGDVAVALFVGADAEERFRSALADEGISALDVHLDPGGAATMPAGSADSLV